MSMEEAPKRSSSAVPWLSQKWFWRVVLIAVVIAVGLLTQRLASRSAADPNCETACRIGPSSAAVVICQKEYAQTKLPVTAACLADSLRLNGKPDEATSVAKGLLSTNARPDALHILAKIAMFVNRTDEAVELLVAARQLHRETGDRIRLAKADQVLATIQAGRGQYAEALQTVDECIIEARRAGDDRVQAYCHLTAARVLRGAGYIDASGQELDRAAQQLSEDRDLAELWFQRGNLEQDVEPGMHYAAYHEQSVAAFERSLEFLKRGRFAAIEHNIHLNLAYSLVELGRAEEAGRHLAADAVLDNNGRYKTERAQLEARIAYRRGDFALAVLLCDRLYPTLTDNDARIDVSVMLARIALAQNDLVGAALWASRGVAQVEQLGAIETQSELRPWVLANRRAAWEVLFSALARASRIEDAMVAFDQRQRRALLDRMARPNADPFRGLSSAASGIQSLERWLPAASKAPLMSSDNRGVALTLGKIDLLALAVAEGDVWRLAAHGGRFRLDDLGSIDKLRNRLDGFIATPTDPVLAAELGALFVPDELVRKTSDPLHVVIDGPLASLPFVALRRNGQPLIVSRPVLRTPRLPVIGPCEPRADIGNTLVLADASGDLTDARRESGEVASLFQTTPLVGDAATSTALFTDRSVGLLHIAVHADVDAGGGILRLHDRAVSAPEIAANKLGPSLVVLSACSTASSWDPELTDSLATAFLAGGARRVVATLRPVSHAWALQLTARFYDFHGVDDPVHVLGRIQAEFAKTDNKEWPHFAVFGDIVCQPDLDASPAPVHKAVVGAQ